MLVPHWYQLLLPVKSRLRSASAHHEAAPAQALLASGSCQLSLAGCHLLGVPWPARVFPTLSIPKRHCHSVTLGQPPPSHTQDIFTHWVWMSLCLLSCATVQPQHILVRALAPALPITTALGLSLGINATMALYT